MLQSVVIDVQSQKPGDLGNLLFGGILDKPVSKPVDDFEMGSRRVLCLGPGATRSFRQSGEYGGESPGGVGTRIHRAFDVDQLLTKVLVPKYGCLSLLDCTRIVKPTKSMDMGGCERKANLS